MPIIVVTDAVMEPCYTGTNARLRDMMLYLHGRGYEMHVVLQRNRVEWEALEFLQRHAADFVVTPIIKAPEAAEEATSKLKRWRNALVWHLSRSRGGVGLVNLARRVAGRPVIPYVDPRAAPIEDSATRCSAETKAALREMARRVEPAAIIVVYTWMAECLECLPKEALRILDTIDVMYLRAEKLREEGLKSAWAATREKEAEILEQFDVVVAIQEEEAQIFREMAPARKVITAGVTFPLEEPAAAPEAGRVLFVGGQNIANVQGINRFLKESWPRVRRARPEATLEICGSVGSLLEKTPAGVKVSGFVESLREAYDAAAVVVNPIWVGSGLKIKTAEALSRSKALVTTQCGVEGMHPAPEGACRMAADDGEVARHIVELLGSPEKRKAQERAAGAYAEKFLTPEKVYAELEAVLREAVGRR